MTSSLFVIQLARDDVVALPCSCFHSRGNDKWWCWLSVEFSLSIYSSFLYNICSYSSLMVRTATRVDNLLALNSISKASSLSLRRKSETDFSWIIRCVANASTGKEVTLDFIFLRTFDRISRRRRLCYCSSSLPSSTSSSCFVPIMLLFSRCQPFFACVKRTRWKTQCSQQQTGSFERGIFSPSRWNYCMCWEIVQTAAKHIADMRQKKKK